MWPSFLCVLFLRYPVTLTCEFMFPGDINYSMKGFGGKGGQGTGSVSSQRQAPTWVEVERAPRENSRHQRVTWVTSFLPPPGQIL